MVDIVVKKDPKNQVPSPPLNVSVVDAQGNMSRPWAIFFREVYQRTSYKGGNAIDNNLDTMEQIIAQVKLNADEIIKNAENIQINTDGIEQNVDDIATNAQAIIDLTDALNLHVEAEQAHGSNGNIVGFNDFADELTYGLVKRMTLISNAITSEAEVTAADAASAPATYNQAYTQALADLSNDNKAAINQVITDFNNAVAVINEIITNSKTAKQMSE